MKFKKEMLLLYAVTDRGNDSSAAFYKKIEDALRGGVTLVQLREKNISEDEFIEKAVKVKEICRRFSVPLIINDSVEVALRSGADGVHVGVTDTAVGEIRKKVSSDFIIGATAKTVIQAQMAEKEGADYLGVGAVFQSPTKKDALRITTEQLKEICVSVSIPVVAIGGINSDNIFELSGAGIAGVAVISALFSAENVQAAGHELRAKAEMAVSSEYFVR